MAELIDRNNLLLTLGQTVNNGKTNDMRKGVFAGLEYCRQLIEMQKVVDAVPVVRCGECKYMKPDGKCEVFADERIRPSVSDFCSYGERRDDNDP